MSAAEAAEWPAPEFLGATPATAADAALLRFVLDQLPLGLCVFDGGDRLLFSNQRYVAMWNLPAHLVTPGTAFAEIIAHTPGVETARSLAQPQPARGTRGTRRREWQLPDGRHIEVVVSRLPDGSCVALHEDVSERRAAEARITFLALHDTLTGLPNRARMRDELERELQRCEPGGPSLAVLCLDLDRFKPVNDTYGHATGDLLLKEVAERLRQCIRSTDLASRLGGDEFAVLQTGQPQPAASTALAKRLIAELSRPFEVAGQWLHINASIGIAIAPFDGADQETLHKSADLALYQAKADGRGTFRYFEPVFDHESQARRGMESDLRLAIERDELQLVYQPLVDQTRDAVAGFEALLRWHHPGRGVVSPADFIALAEETGLIIDIGRWVLTQACREAMRWAPELRVAVNVSAAQFRRGSLARDVLAALRESGLPPERLEIEITESVMLDDMAPAVATLRELKAHGVRVAMDDFGTGYSSLSLLRSFPFDRIKIDRSFVRDLGQRDDALAIIRAVVGLGRSLGMATTVEGVETEQQLNTVRAEGCDEVQGFVYSRPVHADHLHELTAVLNGLRRPQPVFTQGRQP